MSGENELVQPDQEEVVVSPVSEEDTPEPSEATPQEDDGVIVKTGEPETPKVESTVEVEGTEETPPAENVDKDPEPDSEIKAQMTKLEKRLGYLQRQNEKLEKRLTRKPDPEAEDLKAPTAEDFETYEEYQDALVDYKVQTRITEYQGKVSHESEAGDLQEFIDDMLAAGRERYSDFTEVAEANTVPITQPMIQIMKNAEFENPEMVAMYLGKNVKEAQAISRMSLTQATRALTQIETKVAAETKAPPKPKPTKKISDAPTPIKPTGSHVLVTKDPEKMSQREFEQWREQGGGL